MSSPKTRGRKQYQDIKSSIDLVGPGLSRRHRKGDVELSVRGDREKAIRRAAKKKLALKRNG